MSRRTNEGTTHHDMCWQDHLDCALAKLVETNIQLVNLRAALEKIEIVSCDITVENAAVGVAIQNICAAALDSSERGARLPKTEIDRSGSLTSATKESDS